MSVQHRVLPLDRRNIAAAIAAKGTVDDDGKMPAEYLVGIRARQDSLRKLANLSYTLYDCWMYNRVVYERYGAPEVLQVIEFERPPDPTGSEVRIRVAAASLNPTDAKIRRGELSQVFPVQFPATPGVDVAGTVEAAGESSGFQVGDRVFGFAVGGSNADIAMLAEPLAIPDEVSFDQASALPTAGEAALRAYRAANVSAGNVLVVHGAAGAIGSIVTQLAVADDVTVIGTVGTTNDDEMLRDLGGQPVRYGDGWADRVRTALGDRSVDAVLDTSGHGVVAESITLVDDPRRVVTLADMSALSLGATFTGMDPTDRAPTSDLGILANMVGSGTLRVDIWKTYPMDQVVQAHTDLEAGINHGKIILTPAGPR